MSRYRELPSLVPHSFHHAPLSLLARRCFNIAPLESKVFLIVKIALLSLLIHHHNMVFGTSLLPALAKTCLLLPKEAEREFLPISLLSIIRYPCLIISGGPACIKGACSQSRSRALVLHGSAAGHGGWQSSLQGQQQSHHGGGDKDRQKWHRLACQGKLSGQWRLEANWKAAIVNRRIFQSK